MNPFRPGFGTQPMVMVGRDQVVANVAAALAIPGAPQRKTLFAGPRGSGKTVLLDAVQDAATEHGWFVVQEDAGTAGLVGRVKDALARIIVEQNPPPKRRATGAQAVGVGLSWENVAQPGEVSLRRLMEAVVELGSGLLLSIDEVHNADRGDIVELGNAIQHLDRSGYQIAVALAGLPDVTGSAIDDATAATFLKRCDQPQISFVAETEIARGLQETARLAGRLFERDALALAVEVVDGYPYLLQLLGWHAWQQRPSAATITAADVRAAIPDAMQQLGQAVLAPIQRSLSPADRLFLTAMAADRDASGVADIAARLGKDGKYVSFYRDRLLKTGLIRVAHRGYVEFTVPGFRSYMRSLPEYEHLRQLGAATRALPPGAEKPSNR